MQGNERCSNGCCSLTKMAAMPIYVKTFKNVLQNRGCLVAESLHKVSGTGGLPKLVK